ncbi:MAG: diguanylate cyclase/phosphodiesterase with sensor(s) [Acidimicrobiales bacterium]|nr:diguanylate cyclase/phosphodiesterase with sensor(s) [Acidimicrobiales bacterium]
MPHDVPASPEGVATTVGTRAADDPTPLRIDELVDLYEGTTGDVTAVCSTDGSFSHVSAACRTMLGWEPDQLVGQPVADFVHPEEVGIFEAARDSIARSKTVCTVAFRVRCEDGGYLWTESVMRPIASSPEEGAAPVVLSIRDVADRKLMEARLERQAMTDPLTGIANRTVLMDRLGQALRRLERASSVLAVIYLDLDRFKVINDSLGHELGDQLLMRVAERAVGAVRPTDTLARIGGDEFVVLAEGLASEDEATMIAARVITSMEEPFELEGESIVCTTSAGVATTTDFAHSPVGLLQEADLALYRAKERGRNRAEVFDEELRTTAIGRLAIERMIRSAIDDDRLLVQYQPIIDLTSGQVCRYEALVRIQERDRLVLPYDFIDVAEETGLLVKIDEYVLDEAIGQAARWSRDLAFPDFGGVAINVTGRHLADSHFVQVISDALEANDLPAGSVALEVTERVLMEASNSAMDCLRTIRRLGVPIGLDDFGTGYSSLAYLRQFPLDFLKIDRSFVRHLSAGTENVAIVTAIIDLAHAIDLFVVAEGVESEEQMATLTSLECDQAQGYLFGRASSVGAATAVIEDRSGTART